MKTQKWLISLGMIGVLSFLTMTVLGNILWIDYNPITSYISELTADGAPNVYLMRILMNIYSVCFLLFSLAMAVKALHIYHKWVRIGYFLLLIMSFLSVILFQAFPMTVDAVISIQNAVHVSITIFNLCAMIIGTLLIGIGYLKLEKLKKLGGISLTTAAFCFLFNLLHLIAILYGIPILGLLQRLTVYTFNAFTFFISWVYTFRATKTSPRGEN